LSDVLYYLRMRLTPRRIRQLKLGRARELRRELTIAERRAWEILRNRGMLGFKFRRQHVIDGFIVDFYCRELGLVLEIDGAGHVDPEQSEYDAARAAHLEMRGLVVARIPNDQVSEKTLEKLVRDLTRRSPSPQCGEGDRG
jgi:very-short-patch-repair endonuclease